MNESCKRGISTTLALLDKALCEFDALAKGHEVRSILYRVVNPLTQRERDSIAVEVSTMKGILEEIRDALSLEATIRSADKMISGSCAVLWSSLLELESRHLRRYGHVPSSIGEYLDPKVEDLNEHLRRIAAIAAGKGPR